MAASPPGAFASSLLVPMLHRRSVGGCRLRSHRWLGMLIDSDSWRLTGQSIRYDDDGDRCNPTVRFVVSSLTASEPGAT